MSKKNLKKQKHVWPSMRGNEHNTGCSMHAIELKKDSFIKYYFTGNAIFSTPVINRNEIIFVGSADKSFYAIDPIHNAIWWSFRTRGIIDSAACIDNNDNLYVPSGDASLYKLSREGKKQWQFNLLKENYPRISSIYWWEGNIAIGPNGLLYAGNDDFYLYAITLDGEIRWSFSAGLQIWSVPAFNKGLVYFTSFDMCVYALNQDTGRKVWKRRLGNFIASSPAIGENGDVYVTSFDGSIVALYGDSGKIKWRLKTSKSIYASVAIAPDGMIFVGSGDGFLYCINAETGVIAWVLQTGSPIWSSMVIGLDPTKQESYLLYLGTSAGLIIAITPSGQRRWTYHVKASLHSGRTGINASLALGKHGLVAATNAASVVYIPYNAYIHQRKEFIFSDTVLSSKDLPRSHNIGKSNITKNVFKEGMSFFIEKMEFITPEIINPFDQIGIASLVIEVNVIKIDYASGWFTALGRQVVKEGTPYLRTHIYAFEGTIKENIVTLEAKNCDFDIMAFPIPLDHLIFRFSLGDAIVDSYYFRAILDCRSLFKKVIRKYGKRILKYVIRSVWMNIKRGNIQATSTAKTYSAVWYILIGKIWKSWGLINENGFLDAHGTFSITIKEENKD